MWHNCKRQGQATRHPWGHSRTSETLRATHQAEKSPWNTGRGTGQRGGVQSSGEQLRDPEVQPSTDVAMIMMLTVAKCVLHLCCVLGTVLTAWPCAESYSLRQALTLSCYGEGKLRHGAP